MPPRVFEIIARYAQGDCRTALNALEMLVESALARVPPAGRSFLPARARPFSRAPSRLRPRR